MFRCFDSQLLFCSVFKLLGGTEADLTIKAKDTKLYVCRVNDHRGNYDFSEWAKVKVLDIDKSGMHQPFLC